MHYRLITELAIEAGLITPQGLTPEASMNAAMTTDIRRRLDLGGDERFVSYGRGLYGLARHRVGSELEEAIRRSNREVRARLLDELHELDPWAFEDLIGTLLGAVGFVDVEVTARSADGGVDVRGTLAVGGVTNVKTAIQVKKWTGNVAGRTVRELRGGLSPHERGLIISTGGFTRDAQAEAEIAERAPISLVSGEDLVDLLIEHDIGVLRTEVRILRLDPDALLGTDVEAAGPEDGLVAEDAGLREPAQDVQPTVRPIGRRSTRHASGKNLSLWPLPGGQGNFVQTMWMMLTFVSESEPTLDEFIQWMIDSFPRVHSRKTAKGYIEVPRLSGLIESRGDRLVLTTDAAAYLASAEEEDLYRVMASNIAGLDETLAKITAEPCDTRQLTDFLNRELGTEWETEAQATWRVRWLESFGKVERRGDLWFPR